MQIDKISGRLGPGALNAALKARQSRPCLLAAPEPSAANLPCDWGKKRNAGGNGKKSQLQIYKLADVARSGAGGGVWMRCYTKASILPQFCLNVRQEHTFVQGCALICGNLNSV